MPIWLHIRKATSEIAPIFRPTPKNFLNKTTKNKNALAIIKIICYNTIGSLIEHSVISPRYRRAGPAQ